MYRLTIHKYHRRNLDIGGVILETACRAPMKWPKCFSKTEGHRYTYQWRFVTCKKCLERRK